MEQQLGGPVNFMKSGFADILEFVEAQKKTNEEIIMISDRPDLSFVIKPKSLKESSFRQSIEQSIGKKQQHHKEFIPATSQY